MSGRALNGNIMNQHRLSVISTLHAVREGFLPECARFVKFVS